MSYYKEQLRTFLTTQPLPAGKVLSIGCQNNDQEYFGRPREGFTGNNHWVTLDSNAEFKPDVLFNMNRAAFEIEGDTMLYDLQEQFDAVLAFELWEYIYNPVVAHQNIFGFLKPGGVYLGSYPFVYGKHNPAGTDFLRYTDDGIKKLLSLAGFSQIEIVPRITMASSLADVFYAEQMRVRKNIDHNVVGYIVKAKK